MQKLPALGKLALPAIYHPRSIVAAIGLMSYGSSGRDEARQVGLYFGLGPRAEGNGMWRMLRAIELETIALRDNRNKSNNSI